MGSKDTAASLRWELTRSKCEKALAEALKLGDLNATDSEGFPDVIPMGAGIEQCFISVGQFVTFAARYSVSVVIEKPQSAASAKGLPDWSLWRHIPQVKLWQAVLLSLNVDPDGLDSDYTDFDDALEATPDAIKRLRLLIANLSDRTYFRPSTLNLGDSRLHGVYLADFSRWAVSKMLWPNLPSEFVSIAGSLPTEFSKVPTARNPDVRVGKETSKNGNPTPEIRRAKRTSKAIPEKTNVIPGKLPRIEIAKLAIKAAWEIEQKTKRTASAKDVMQRLQDWAEGGNEPEVLMRAEKNKRAVSWRTVKGAEKSWDVQACGTALQRWIKSRNN